MPAQGFGMRGMRLYCSLAKGKIYTTNRLAVREDSVVAVITASVPSEDLVQNPTENVFIA